jgi:hypothetical protein
MQYQTKTTPEQLKAAAAWCEDGQTMADVELRAGADDRLVVEQGDSRVAFNEDGQRVCEECGAHEGEELQGDCCYSCGAGCDDYEQASTPECRPTTANGKPAPCEVCGEQPEAHTEEPEHDHEYVREPEGDRIAREGRAMLAAACDIDYDPAAEDEDGVPLFSEQTRAEVAGDPRGERDR